MEMGTQRSLWRGATFSQPGWALRLWLLLSVSGASEVFRPSLFQPQPSVVSGQGNPKIWCVVRGAPARAHVLSWYQQLMGKGPTFLLSQREGAPPAYGSGVNPRFLAEIDPARNAACLTVGNASPADEGTYYCAVWYSGQFIFGEGTRLLYQAEMQPAPRPPQLSLFIPPSGPPFQALCVALGHHPDPLRVSWVLRGQHQEEQDFTGGAGAPTVSWLHLLPQEVAGTSVTCQGLHQSGVLDVVLPLPWGQGCRGRLDTESGNEMHENGGDTALAELEQTLGAVTSCYLGLLSAALVYGLVLAAVWRSRYCCVHPVEPPTRAGQGAASGSGAQAGRRHAPAGALQREGRSPSSFRVLR